MSLRSNFIEPNNYAFSPQYWSLDYAWSEITVSPEPSIGNVERKELKEALRSTTEFTLQLMYYELLNFTECKVEIYESNDTLRARYMLQLKPGISPRTYEPVAMNLGRLYCSNENAFVASYSSSAPDVKSKINTDLKSFQDFAFPEPLNNAVKPNLTESETFPAAFSRLI